MQKRGEDANYTEKGPGQGRNVFSMPAKIEKKTLILVFDHSLIKRKLYKFLYKYLFYYRLQS